MSAGVSRRFRKLGVAERRAALDEALDARGQLRADLESPLGDELADVLVEHAVGVVHVPMGVAAGFVVDAVQTLVPLATEEPSVIAASSYAATLVSTGGGFGTWATDPVMCAHVYLEGVSEPGLERLEGAESEVREALRGLLRGMTGRGGGYRGYGIRRLSPDVARAEIRLDVRDAMGANLLNSAAECVRGLLERLGGGKTLMGILSNNTVERRAGARFDLPLEDLGPACPPGMAATELARRVLAASQVAQIDPDRAVTHNKGILNGISALALATGNDTRAVEAAAHAWACRSGLIRGLSRYALGTGPRGPSLKGEIELPLPLGTVGGSVGLAPACRAALRILGNPDGARLGRIAAAVGLAQNLAALIALCGSGIQKGHLPLAARRLAWKVGARGPEVSTLAPVLAAEMASGGGVSPERAAALLRGLRSGGK